MRTGVVIFLLLLVFPLAAAPPAPSVSVDRAGTLSVLLDGSIVSDDEVRKHVKSGLTMNFVVGVAGSKTEGLITIRWEPWDEVFYVRTIDYDARSQRATLGGFAELERWISSMPVRVGRTRERSGAVLVTASVVPFSESEETDAKTWVARSLSEPVASPGAEPAEAAAPEPSSLFSAVISSSIRRKPVLKFRWRVVPEQAVK
ncbi:MAG: hypothetical protein KY432_00720 [Acidobacteria bacterium]|nr:hypothetical protein [Acidobacteriota bacterium]